METMTGQEQYAEAVDVVVHPGFNSMDRDSAYAHDLMLLRVEPPFTITPYVQPLALPTSPPATGTNCMVMGWGTTTSPEGRGGPWGMGGVGASPKVRDPGLQGMGTSTCIGLGGGLIR